MTTHNNLHIPDDLPSAVNEAASADGKTADEVTADALRRYLAHRELDELGRYGSEQSRRLGYTKTDLPRLIAESRREHSGCQGPTAVPRCSGSTRFPGNQEF